MQKGQTHGPNARSADITGQTFGRLTAVRFVRMNHNSKQVWRFKCECGRTTEKVANTVMSDARRGHKPGCGCQQYAGGRRTHGMHGTREYFVWKGIKQRCLDKNSVSYHNYGGRGVTICDRWREDFAAFLADMGPAPSRRHTVEREDNDKGYEPGNCRWATRGEQSRNKRDNRLLTFKGKTQTVTDWAAELGINKSTLFHRLDGGWSAEQALTAAVGAPGAAVMLTYDGRTMSLRDWARETGIPFQTLYYRAVKARWPAARVLGLSK